jgi:hypothetical protein
MLKGPPGIPYTLAFKFLISLVVVPLFVFTYPHEVIPYIVPTMPRPSEQNITTSKTTF